MSGEVVIPLCWARALSPGTSELIEDADVLRVPAVYVAVADYPDKSVVYVGQSVNFLERARSHIVAILGLTYWLRDDRGDWAYEPADEIAFLKMMSPTDLKAVQALARDTIRRTVWYYAPIEPEFLKPVEGLLIRKVRWQENQGATIGSRGILCDNGNLGMQLSHPFEVRISGAEPMVSMFGKSVVWPLENAA